VGLVATENVPVTESSLAARGVHRNGALPLAPGAPAEPNRAGNRLAAVDDSRLKHSNQPPHMKVPVEPALRQTIMRLQRPQRVGVRRRVQSLRSDWPGRCTGNPAPADAGRERARRRDDVAVDAERPDPQRAAGIHIKCRDIEIRADDRLGGRVGNLRAVGRDRVEQLDPRLGAAAFEDDIGSKLLSGLTQ
jgi:hypothetical protein